jgi:hypothetical protein
VSELGKRRKHLVGADSQKREAEELPNYASKCPCILIFNPWKIKLFPVCFCISKTFFMMVCDPNNYSVSTKIAFCFRGVKTGSKRDGKGMEI